jgi:hypothetical protein
MKELQVLERVIFSILTPAIADTLKKRPNFDIKKQTSGAERMFTAILHFMDHAHSFIFHNYLWLASVTDQGKKFSQSVCAKRVKAVLAVVVFHHTDVLFITESTGFHLSADDVLILANNTCLVMDSYENTWTPIWLPTHQQMLHILSVPISINRYTFKSIFISNLIDGSQDCTRMAEEITRGMSDDHDVIRPIVLPRIDKIRHWLIADRLTERLYTPFLGGDFSDIIYRNYAWVYEYLKNTTIGANGMFYIATEEITIFGRHNHNETIIAAADIGCKADEAQQLFRMLNEELKDVRNNLQDHWLTFPE